MFVIGEKYNPSPAPTQQDRVVIGGQYVEQQQNCVGGRCAVLEDRSQPIMMMMDTSGLPVIGIGRNKRNLMIRRVRKNGGI